MSINENNIVSKSFVTLWEIIPLKTLLLTLVIITYIFAIYKNQRKWNILVDFLSLIIMDFLFKLSITTFILEDITHFFLFKITNPVPLLHNIDDVLSTIIENNKIQNHMSSEELESFLSITIDLNKIKECNAEQITDYLYDMFNVTLISNYVTNKIILSLINSIYTSCFIFILILKWII